MLLGRGGLRVLLVDKADFRADNPLSHFIQPEGVARLKRWGLLEPLAKGRCSKINWRAVDFPECRLAGWVPALEGESESYCVPGELLEAVLMDAARAAGAELRQNFTVQDLVFENGSVIGLRGRTAAGTITAERARIVIGADGAHSVLARLVDAPEYNVVEPLTCGFYSYWSGAAVRGAELIVRPGHSIFAAPAHQGLTLISLIKPRATFRQFRSDPEGAFQEARAMSPVFAELVRAGRREADFRGAVGMTNYFRHPFGPGWALVGDAGYCRDAITAQGVTDALRDAELLTVALERGLSEQVALEEALAEYHCQRDMAVSPMYGLTCKLARLGPFYEEHQALWKALRGNQPETNRFLGTLAGTVSIREFYSPENIDRIICGQTAGTA
jgi:flavin-dependent dehydrogenase